MAYHSPIPFRLDGLPLPFCCMSQRQTLLCTSRLQNIRHQLLCPRVRRWSVAVRLLGWRVRIPLEVWTCFLWVLWSARCRALRLADHPSRGVLPSVMCPVSVIAEARKTWLWPWIGSNRHRRRRTWDDITVPCFGFFMILETRAFWKEW